MIANHHTRVDRSVAADWIRGHVVDQQGRFFGTCDQGPEHLRDRDLDRDGIPDPCDPCPRVRDDNYRDTGVIRGLPNPSTCGLADTGEFGDLDCDGVPNACDNCPADSNPHDFSVGPSDPPFVLPPFFTFQPDRDLDGMGDACDCPFSDLRGISDVQCVNARPAPS